MPRARNVLLLLFLVFTAASPSALAQTSSGAESVAPEGEGFCYTNLQGLGICEGTQLCPKSSDCDAATPCPAGTVCTVGTACLTSLAGVCLYTIPDGGCSNPGTFEGGLFACHPILFHEDFAIPIAAGAEGAPPGIDKLSVSTICGSGGTLFKETSCAANDFASSPLATARWAETPSVCTSYASADHRVVASTGTINVSSCRRSQLDFDYLIQLQEGGIHDRVFVTVGPGILVGPEGFSSYEPVLATVQTPGAQAFTSSQMSCGGSVLPVGKLIRDGAWHHFRAPLGDASQVEVKFWAETSNGSSNSGQGWFFDDVRIDCSALIFEEGFEGGNLLLWSFTTAPPLLVGVVQAGACKAYGECGGPGSGCVNLTTAEGPTYCLSGSTCIAAPCSDSTDCAAGELCIVDSCCGFSLCAPANCTPGSQIFGPESAATTGG